MKKHWKAWAALGLLIVLTPIGLLATGTAWGEWGAGELGGQLGFVPAGVQALSDFWQAPLPDYGFAGASGGTVQSAAAYIISAVIGVALTAGAAWLLTRMLARKEAAGEDSTN